MRTRVRNWLLTIWAIVIGLGLLAEVSYYRLGDGPLAPLANRVELFSLSYEQNVPTWYSSGLLFLCAVVLAVIATVRGQERAAFVRHWWALSAIFAYISLDEMISIHENWGGWTRAGGVLTFDWVIPGAICVTVFLLAYLRFLKHLSSASRDAFVLSGAVYVGGALGVECFLGYWTDLHGMDNLGYALIDFVEESMEILGASLFLLALLRELPGQASAPVAAASSSEPAPPEHGLEPDCDFTSSSRLGA